MTKKKNIEKILIIKPRAIGDVVLSTIVLENLRAAFPQARIDFLTEDICKEVVLANTILNNVIVFERKNITKLPSLRKIMANVKFLKAVLYPHYDLVLDFYGNPRSAFLTLLSGARIRVGYDFRIRKWAYTQVVKSRAAQVHETEWHLDALRALDIPIISKKLYFEIGMGSEHFANNFWKQAGLEGQRVIALNFSGGWPAKKWPIDRFAHLADLMIEQHQVKIIINWGPGERFAAESLKQYITRGAILIPDANLRQLAAILQKTDLLVTTDSGPMHIAAAMGIPCVALFGPTDPNLQGPYGEGHVIVRKNSLDCLGCNRLDCSHQACLNTLTVAEVLEGVGKCIQINNLFQSPRLL